MESPADLLRARAVPADHRKMTRPRSVPTFLLAPSDQGRVMLRRFARRPDGLCSGPFGIHNAAVALEATAWTPEVADRAVNAEVPDIIRADARWPRVCDLCDYTFTPGDEWQRYVSQLYTRSDGGELVTLRDAPAGAMWIADWYRCAGGTCGYGWTNCDGNHLIVRLPGGHDWDVNGRASNCDRKDDNLHRCWVSHGTPPAVNVDKAGHTCGAGAGSIAVSGYHGFLRHGVLEEC